MDKNITDRFIDMVLTKAGGELSAGPRRQAADCLLDYLGVTLAGARLMREKGLKLLAFLDDGPGVVSVIGYRRKAGLLPAALLNGLSAHAVELDDGVRFGMMHPGAPVISALLPAAEREKAGGEVLLRGIIAGYEAAARLAAAVQPAHKERGWHATGTCGAAGAAFGVGVMLGFDRRELKDAFSAATTGSGGLLRVLDGDSELKPFNVARAAVNGLQAAMLARAGFRGPEEILGGQHGFLDVMSGAADDSWMEAAALAPLVVGQVYFKSHAACRHCHPAIDAVLQIRAEAGIRPEQVRRVRVKTYRLAVAGHDHARVGSVSSARMSIPFSVAVALATGRAGLHAFGVEKVADPVIASLAEKVTVIADDALSALVPARRPAAVEIELNDGGRLRARVDLPRGEPENPLSAAGKRDKFADLAAWAGLSPARAGEIAACVTGGDPDPARLFSLL